MKLLLNRLSKIGLALVVVVQLGLIFSPISFARDAARPSDLCLEAPDTVFCKNQTENPAVKDPIKSNTSPLLGRSSIFYKIIQLVTVLTGAISIIMIMVGGFRYVVSGGDSTATKASKDTILYAVIGLAIALFAQTIITFVLGKIE